MQTVIGKVHSLQKYCAGLTTAENKKIRVYFDGPASYKIACDAHIIGADIIIEYDTVLSETPFEVFCETAKIVE